MSTNIKRTKEEIIDEINEVIDSIRFYIAQDGGDLEFISFDENSGIVTIRILGACVGCSLLDLTYTDGVEKILVSEINEVKGLEIIEGE